MTDSILPFALASGCIASSSLLQGDFSDDFIMFYYDVSLLYADRLPASLKSAG